MGIHEQDESHVLNKRDYYGRKVNMMIFSLYTYDEAFHEITNDSKTYEEHWYLGIFNNFIEVGKKHKPTGYVWED